MSDQRAALTYSSYLGLDEVLGAQRPRTAEHDELLFIVIHQVDELWFKELLHEGAHLQRRLEDGDTTHALHTLKRMLTILKTVVAQIDVLETMTPRQFLTFRDRLEAASGFQSAQFRELEALLGRRDPRALDAYAPDSVEHARIAAAMARPSLFDSFVRYLANQGYSAAAAALDRDVTQPLEPSDGGPTRTPGRLRRRRRARPGVRADDRPRRGRHGVALSPRPDGASARSATSAGPAARVVPLPRDDAAAAGLPRSVGRAHGVVSAARQRRWPGGGISSRRAGRSAEAGARPAAAAAAARAPEPRETQSAGCTGRASTACQVAGSVSPLARQAARGLQAHQRLLRRRAEHAVDGDVGREGDQVLLQPDDLVALGALVERRPARVLQRLGGSGRLGERGPRRRAGRLPAPPRQPAGAVRRPHLAEALDLGRRRRLVGLARAARSGRRRCGCAPTCAR